ncbi:MAG: hypothetical protein OHK0015_06040 [Chloroflexi bacterium OHK40]
MNQIQAAFRFTDSDLAANRQGWATEQQVRRLAQGSGCGFAIAGATAAGMFLFAFVAGLAVVAGAFVFGWSAGSGGISAMRPSSAIGILAPFVLGLSLLGFLLLLAVRIRRDRSERRVARCSGPFRIESRFLETDSLSKTLHVDGRRFKINPFQSRALRPYQGRRITVYYFPHAREIASIELVGHHGECAGGRTG